MVTHRSGVAQRVIVAVRPVREKNHERFLTARDVYGTKYNNDENTCDVDPVLTCSRDLWRIALGDLRTGRVTRETTQALLWGTRVRSESLFFCIESAPPSMARYHRSRDENIIEDGQWDFVLG